jgi:hypothetical protein
MKKNIHALASAAAISVLLIGSLANPLEAKANDELPWSGDMSGSESLVMELWEDPRSQVTQIIRAIDYFNPPTQGNQQQRLCYSLTTGHCAEALRGSRDALIGTFVAPVCSGARDENCIEWISVHSADQPPIRAQLIRSLPALKGTNYQRVARSGLPRPGTTSLWKQAGQVNQAGAETYAAILRIDIEPQKRSNSVPLSYQVLGYSLQIKPYSELTGDFSSPACEEYTSRGVTGVGCGGAPEQCAFSEDGLCGKEVGFPEDSVVTASFRINGTTSGWFAGRVQAPDISVNRLNASQIRVQISGKPNSIPVARGGVKTKDAPASLKNIYTKYCPSFRFDNGCWAGVLAASKESIDYLEGFRRPFRDTATYMRQSWSVNSVSLGPLGYCARGPNKVVGIVSTNSMAYQPEPPSFRGGFLNYLVAGMHYLPDGSLARGSYDLVVRSDFASCLYRFGSAPLSATVSVVNDKGVRSFATTTVGEKNGWLKLSAKGFTYSKKTIKVKITKAKAKATKKRNR